MERSAASVLIIEDDPRTESLERALLEERGYSVTSAVSGEDAIDLVSDSDPDLILLDVGLPGIDGFTACKVIRKFSETPIIMVTGSNSVSDKVKGMETGADDYITKPFSHEEFLARANTVLRRANFTPKSDSPTEQTSESSAKYIVRREGKPVSRTIATPEANPRRQSIQRQVWIIKKSIARNLPVLRDQLARDGRIIYTNITGRDIPARDLACPRWRHSWLITSTLSAALARIAIEQSKKTLELLHRWAKLKVEKSLEDRRTKKSVRGVHYSNRAVQNQVSAGLANTPDTNAGLSPAAASTAEVTPPEDSYVLEVLESVGAITIEEEYSAEISDVIQPKIEQINRDLPPTEQSASARFLDALLSAYLVQAEARCDDPMLASPVIPLLEIHPLVAESLRKGSGYTREEFAQEVYHLQIAGLETTLTGAKVQFPISRGVPGKTLTTMDMDGREVRYYGIRFIQTDSTSNRPATGRIFDLLEAPLYGLEIQELFGKQLDWPSTEFAAFLASQLQLEEPTSTELRLLAQITRDSLRRFIQGQAVNDKGPLRVAGQE